MVEVVMLKMLLKEGLITEEEYNDVVELLNEEKRLTNESV